MPGPLSSTINTVCYFCCVRLMLILPSTLVDHTVKVVRDKSGKLPTLVEREIDYIRYVLERSGQNRTKAANILGIDRVSLWRKLKKYDIE